MHPCIHGAALYTLQRGLTTKQAQSMLSAAFPLMGWLTQQGLSWRILQLGLNRIELPTSAVHPISRKRARPAVSDAAAAAGPADSAPSPAASLTSAPAALGDPAKQQPFSAADFTAAAMGRLQVMIVACPLHRLCG